MTSSGQIEDRAESGTAAVEFAFVMPILILFLFGIIEFGSIFFVKHTMLLAARQTARLMTVDDLPGSGISVACAGATAGSAEESACNQLLGLGLSFSVTARQPDPTDPNDNDVLVEISVPASDAAMVDVLGLIGTQNLQARAVMRKEGA